MNSGDLQPGSAALKKFYKGFRTTGRPLVFLDLDDVICINKPYGGRDILKSEAQVPTDLWERLWHPPAVATLKSIFDEFAPQVVITSSWLRFLDRAGVASLFRKTGLELVASALHPTLEAPQNHGATRLHAIETWLGKYYNGQPVVVLDDAQSGTGLRGSRLDRAGHVVLCETDVGLHQGHLPTIRNELRPSIQRA